MAEAVLKRRAAARSDERLAHETLRNGLILRKLEKMISYQDLQNLRSVSKTLNGAVLNETGFLSRSTVILCAESLQKRLFQNFGFNIKHVRFEPYVDSKPYDGEPSTERFRQSYTSMMDRFWESAHGLETLMTFRSGDEKSVLLSVDWISRTIQGTMCLTALHLTKSQLMMLDGMENWIDLGLDNHFARVTELHILVDCDDRPRLPLHRTKPLLAIPHLRKIGIFRPSISQGQHIHNFGDLTSLIQAHSQTLEELQIQDSPTIFPYVQQNYLFLSHFPRLRKVFLETSGDISHLHAFLHNHRNQLVSVRLVHPNTFPVPVIDEINGLNGQFLQELELDYGHSQNWPQISWHRFPGIKSVQLCHRQAFVNNPGGGPVLQSTLHELPDNVQKIHLSELPESHIVFSAHKIQTLINVKVLCLINVSTAISDPVLHSIFQHMTQLQVLELHLPYMPYLFNEDPCTQITANGFLGIVLSPRGFTITDHNKSLSNLQHLTSLNLRLYSLSNDVINTQIQFPQLRSLSLNLRHRFDMTVDELESLIGQNPSLEVLDLRPFSKPDKEKSRIRTLLRREFPKIKLFPQVDFFPRFSLKAARIRENRKRFPLRRAMVNIHFP